MLRLELVRKVFQNQSEPFSLRRSTVITREPVAGPRYRSKDFEARANCTACGGIVEGTPKSGSPRSPTPHRARSHRISAAYHQNGIILFPLAFCLTDRSTIRDESPIERTTVEPVNQFLLLYVGWSFPVRRPKKP
jgi:hypothetical protein